MILFDYDVQREEIKQIKNKQYQKIIEWDIDLRVAEKYIHSTNCKDKNNTRNKKCFL